MKTTDSVMRELNEEIENRLQMIPHPDDRRKFRGLIQRIRTADKRVFSHSLAEARREEQERILTMAHNIRSELKEPGYISLTRLEVLLKGDNPEEAKV